MSHPTKKTRSKSELYLIGVEKHQIMGAKLPSKRQVLSVYFYNIKTVGLSQFESLQLLYYEIRVFWDKARIPISSEQYVKQKILDLLESYRNLQKTPPSKKSQNELKNESDFVDKLDDLFDIAALDALQKLKGIANFCSHNERKVVWAVCLVLMKLVKKWKQSD